MTPGSLERGVHFTSKNTEKIGFCSYIHGFEAVNSFAHFIKQFLTHLGKTAWLQSLL